jgi:hypothetical protein
LFQHPVSSIVAVLDDAMISSLMRDKFAITRFDNYLS